MPVTRLTLAVIFIVAMAFTFTAQGPAWADDKDPLILLKAQTKVQQALNSLDEQTAEASRQLSGVELDSYQAGKILRWLRVEEMQIIVASTVSSKGVLVRMEPYEYSRFQGSDISKQPQVQFMLTKHQLLLDPFGDPFARLHRQALGRGPVQQRDLRGQPHQGTGSPRIDFLPPDHPGHPIRSRGAGGPDLLDGRRPFTASGLGATR